MTKISKRLAQVINKELVKTIVPVKTDRGILVGSVEIVSVDNLKNIWKNGNLVYANVYLNISAIKIANLLAFNSAINSIEQIYQADQDYGRYFEDSQLLRSTYEKSCQTQDFERADIIWARYIERRDRALSAKKRVESLTSF
jgi:hypothetical protein